MNNNTKHHYKQLTKAQRKNSAAQPRKSKHAKVGNRSRMAGIVA